MFIVAKTIKGKEYMYSHKTSILCKSEKQANELSDYLNSHNVMLNELFKLNSNEIWFVYEIDNYTSTPAYILCGNLKNGISVKYNN